ncbi:MAG TPA: glycosyltransferase family 4 protein [Solirubrobacteraceae bacterium]|jgi:glycosyltransferase involved in cell wall biosynthesis|nr:glycosyltransferase family 4 protein [Solirubrobacteraceae bacterium]
MSSLGADANGGSRRLRVLYVVHNHPSLHPGGAEAYALELYQAMREIPAVEPILLARIGSNVARRRAPHPGTPFSSVNGDPNQHFVFTETEHFDFFNLTSRDKSLYSRHLTDFLLAQRPDVVHVQHTHFIGMDLLSLIRRVLPGVPIVYTLHEFLPICHRDGQMVRTFSSELCTEASPRRCNECFPDISPPEFFLRERFVKGHMHDVDRFLAPSAQLRERYLRWGIEPGRIEVEEYGRRAPVVRAPEPAQAKSPTNIGFFGQLSYFKGAKVMLEAMSMLAEDCGAHLWLHGANLELQTREFQEEFAAMHDELRGRVTFRGPYEHSELPKLMADLHWVVVPSVWWENSPLVIQEAFFHRRPVICSDVGGMAEKVRDGVDGMHFRVGDAFSLARAFETATSSPRLWRSLRDGIREPYGMDTHVAWLLGAYGELLGRREAVTIGG